MPHTKVQNLSSPYPLPPPPKHPVDVNGGTLEYVNGPLTSFRLVAYERFDYNYLDVYTTSPNFNKECMVTSEENLYDDIGD